MTSMILACLAAFSPTPAKNPTIVDLNRDARPDTIGLQCERGGWAYTLTVNGAGYQGKGEVLEGTFSIVDVDTTDAFLEIAVSQEGPSDDYETYFHFYDGDSVRFMGGIPGTYELLIDGSGRIRTENRGERLATWFYPCTYALRDHHVLRQVVQEIYPMDTRCTMKVALPLCASRSDTTTVTVLRPGDVVTFVASDDERWFLVQAPSGVWGWFALSKYDVVLPLGLHAYDVFDGLSYAD